MTKKEIAYSFLIGASSGTVREAFEDYIHKDFIHHLVFFRGDRESFLAAMEENQRKYPNKKYEAIHLIEEDNYVAIHGKVTLDSIIYSVIHIFRFQNDKIIESWEASQQEIKDSPNEYGLF